MLNLIFSSQKMNMTDNLRSEINKTLEFFKYNSKVNSVNNDGVLDHPFFESNCNSEFKSNDTTLENHHLIFFNKYCFDIKLKTIYNYIGNDKEISVNQFTFLSLDEIIKRSENYEYILDIGVIYMGMGHIEVLSMSKKDGKFFFRMDGGSNGYEREDNYNKYKNYQPKLNELLNFNQVLNKIKFN